jgi:hypothetical protein
VPARAARLPSEDELPLPLESEPGSPATPKTARRGGRSVAAMTSTTSRRIGAASGIAYVVLVGVGNTLDTAGSKVDDSSSAAAVLADLRDHDTLLNHVGIAMELLGFLALVAFVAYLAGVLRRAEDRDGWLAGAAYAAGALTLAVKVASIAPILVAHLRLDTIDANTARLLVDLNSAAFFVTLGTTAAFVGFASLSALGSGALPRRLAVIGAILGALGLVTLAFGYDGPAVLPFLLSLLWLAAVSVVQLRATTTEGAPQGALASVS